MNLQSVKNVYLLGIGGIGMSALARYFHAAGKKVSGYDKTPTALTSGLISEGIDVTYSDDVNSIPEEIRNGLLSDSLIIYTPAVPRDHVQYNYFLNQDVVMHKRSVVLGWITQQSFTIAVAGTHGKTTTSCIIAHILKSAGVNCTAFLGGISTNYNSNLILGDVNAPDSVIVVEADEFDRSFLTLYPDIAIITSMDADHLDIYGDKMQMEDSFRLFARQIKPGGHLFIKSGLPIGEQTAHQHTYGIETDADYSADAVSISSHQYLFNVKTPDETFKKWQSGLPGRHNVENAVAAIAVALQLNVPSAEIKSALASFQGVKRRFEYILNSGPCTFIDDYAHHPAELHAAISSVKELYTGKKVTGIFQPHLFTRTRDFADEFAASLSLLDSLILLDIYPARELPIEGVSSAMILEKVNTGDKVLCSKEELLKVISSRKPEVLLTLGAGDIDQLVQPLKNILQ